MSDILKFEFNGLRVLDWLLIGAVLYAIVQDMITYGRVANIARVVFRRDQ